jgi:hypothetical protein
MAQGPADDRWKLARPAESLLAIAPPTALAVVVLILGLYIPPAVHTAVEEAARLLG